MKLYGVHLSPYFERAYLVLEHKNALDKVEMAGLPTGGIKSKHHLEVNPAGQIPYLIKDDGTTLPEGQLIAEYFDTMFDGPALISNDNDAATQEKLICRLVDFHMFNAMRPCLQSSVWGRHDEEAVKEAVEVLIPRALDVMENYLSDSLRAAGDDWTMADFALIPAMFHFTTFLPEFGIDGLGDRPKLNAWWENTRDHEIVERSHGRMLQVLEYVMNSIKPK